MMKALYVSLVRSLRRVLGSTGLLDALEQGSGRGSKYVRSLFAIYDVEDMARLDLPWWTFAATETVARFLVHCGGRARVFEYGPGASTLWLSKRAARVAYVEHDEAFAQKFGRLVLGASNIVGRLAVPTLARQRDVRCGSGCKGYELLDFVDYVEAIRDSGGPFDLVVIDGRSRVACLDEAIRHLRPGGLIVFDNSRRTRYQQALSGLPLPYKRYWGLAPALPYPEETTLVGPR